MCEFREYLDFVEFVKLFNACPEYAIECFILLRIFTLSKNKVIVYKDGSMTVNLDISQNLCMLLEALPTIDLEPEPDEYSEIGA